MQYQSTSMYMFESANICCLVIIINSLLLDFVVTIYPSCCTVFCEFNKLYYYYYYQRLTLCRGLSISRTDDAKSSSQASIFFILKLNAFIIWIFISFSTFRASQKAPNNHCNIAWRGLFTVL